MVHWCCIGNGEKSMGDKKVQKEKAGRKLPRSFKVNELPDAIVDQKFLGQIGAEIIVNRFRSGKEVFSICVVKEIKESGLVNVWDDTNQQWFSFTATDSPKIVKLYKKDLI